MVTRGLQNRRQSMRSPTPRAGQAVPGQTPAGVRATAPGKDTLAQTLAGEYLVGEIEEREAEARKRRPPRPWRRIVSTVAIAACGAVWLVPSLGTRPTPAVSAGRQDASARLTLYLASRRVRDFEERNGRLPSSGVESGISDPRIGYRLTGPNTFALSLSDNGQRWVLRSTFADMSYLHDAMRNLGAAPK